jgi:hypothetical protein
MSAAPRIWRRLASAQDGAALVEFSLVGPMFLLLLLGLMQFGLAAWRQNELQFAVQQAARCANVRPDLCGDPAATAAYAAGRIRTFTVEPSAFSVSEEACGVRVRGELEAPIIAVGLPGPSRVRAEVCRP